MIARILSAIVLLLVAIFLFIAAWPEFLGLQRSPFVAQLVAFRGASAAAALALALVLSLGVAVSRSFRRFGGPLIALLVIFALVNTAILGSRGLGSSSFTTKAETDLTVVSWNTLGGAPGAQTIATLALNSRADVVSLPETNKETADAIAALMTAAGRPMTAHTTSFSEVLQAQSTSVLVSTALGAYTIDTGSGSTTTLPSVVLRPTAATSPVIVAVHPVAPSTKEMTKWKADLAWVSGICNSGNVILAGDFNATVDHLSGFETTTGATVGGCFDAGQQSGNAALGTWPTSVPALLGTPIDHVMFTGNWRVSGMDVIQTLDVMGSDHRPIVVQLSPR